MNLRKAARGRQCQVRLPVCNGDPETVVLAHFRLAGISGMGMKSPDLIGAWACSACHQASDSPASFGLDKDTADLALAHGVFRTQNVLIREGKVKW